MKINQMVQSFVYQPVNLIQLLTTLKYQCQQHARYAPLTYLEIAHHSTSAFILIHTMQYIVGTYMYTTQDYNDSTSFFANGPRRNSCHDNFLKVGHATTCLLRMLLVQSYSYAAAMPLLLLLSSLPSSSTRFLG